MVLTCSPVIFAQADLQQPAAAAEPVAVRLVDTVTPLRIQTVDEQSLVEPNLLVALSSLAVAALAFALSVSQWRKQYQTTQMETCERMFSELRRAELDFKTPIDAEYAKSPANWQPHALRRANLVWEYAAWAHYSLWDYLAFLVLQKRIDDKAMLVLIERKGVYAFGELKTYAPDWLDDSKTFPYFKELCATYVRQ
jgi:hypothetical protein